MLHDIDHVRQVGGRDVCRSAGLSGRSEIRVGRRKHSLRVYLSTIQPAVFLTNWKHVASSSTAVL